MGFAVVLEHINRRLGTILSDMLLDIESEGANGMMTIADRLLKLHDETDAQLCDLGHRVLSATIRDAAVSLNHWAREKGGDVVVADDREYLREVYQALKDINDRIGTGEYYSELMKIKSSRLREGAEV